MNTKERGREAKMERPWGHTHLPNVMTRRRIQEEEKTDIEGGGEVEGGRNRERGVADD